MIREQQGIAEAENLLEDLDFNQLPIKPIDVVKRINCDDFPVHMEYQNFSSNSILGRSEGNSKAALIYVNANIPDNGRLNFTAAHEVGHVAMHIMQEKKMKFDCGAPELRDSFKDPLEKEANGFASGLLMPKRLITNLIDGAINWQNIGILKKECDVSLEAGFRRLAYLSSESAAMVIHEKGRFKRYIPNPSFEFFIEQAHMTEDMKSLCADGLNGELSSDFEEVDPIDWVRPNRDGRKLDFLRVSSISLKNDITYSILQYDDDCISEDDED